MPFPVSSFASPMTPPGGSSTTPPRVVFCPLRTSHPVEPVEVAVDSGAARGTEPAGAGPGGAVPGVAESEVGEPGGAEPERAEPGGVEPGGFEPGGAEPERAEFGGPPGVPSRRAPLSPQRLHEWYARRCHRAAGATRGASGAGATRGPTGFGAAGGAGAAGPGGARTGGTGVDGAGGAAGVGAVGARSVATGGAAGAGAAGGNGAGGAARVVAGDPESEGTGALSAVSGGVAWPRPYYVPLLKQVLDLPPSTGPTPPLLSLPPVQSKSRLQPASPLPGPSPYSGPTRGLTERREPDSRPVSPVSRAASPVRTARAGRVSRPRPPSDPGTHSMTLRPSTAPKRVPLPTPPTSSLPDSPDPESDSLRAASPTVTRFLATAVTDPFFESTAASALVAELVDFAAVYRLYYAASLVAERSLSALRLLYLISLDFSTAFLQGSLHEEIWLCRPPGFTGSFCAGTQWSLRRPVYGLRQAPREWHDTLRTTVAALGFAPSTADPSLFLHTDTTLSPFYILVYVDDLVFATADTGALAHVKSELQKRHTCIDLVRRAWGSCLEDGLELSSLVTETLPGLTTWLCSGRHRVTPSALAPALSAIAAIAAIAANAATLATAPIAAMASPTVLTFDAEGRVVDFDDLQLFLQCDSRDGVSLFDHTSGVSTAPAATADSTVRSRRTTRDAVACLAVRSHLPPAERAHFGQYKTAQSLYDTVVARYSSPATAALSRLMLPYIFPDLATFATVADLDAHLRTSDARYRAALPTEDNFLSLCPIELTVDLLEELLAAAEKSILALRLPLVGDAATTRARGARVVEGAAGEAVEEVEEAEEVAVEVGVVPGVGATVAAVEVVAAVAEVVEAVATVVEVAAAVVLVEVQPRSVEALVATSASSSCAPVRPRRSTSFVSGTLGVGGLG
ncbi:unnamed protein product, partial [Closterium sp. NIES-53]